MRRSVAIVGAGPSGFYVAEALLTAAIDVHVYDQLPVPYGLVRHGVAPDHQKLKQVSAVFERIAASAGFTFHGNVRLGETVGVHDLLGAYDAVVLAIGAESDALLGIEGEDLPGVHSAREFVGWYNGHPDLVERRYDLSHEDAVVVGHGNVALDVARMLMAPVDYLRSTDITPGALEQLSTSRVRRVHLVGRRGAAQGRFTDKELRQIADSGFCDLLIDEADLALGAACATELATKGNTDSMRMFEMFRRIATTRPSSHARALRFHFLSSPERIVGNARIEQLIFRRNVLAGLPFEQRAVGSDRTTALDCGLLLRSVGFRGVPLPGVPFDPVQARIPSRDARVTDLDGAVIERLYVAGWAKRGPSGVIGTNRACGVATARAVVEDLASTGRRTSAPGESVRRLLDASGVRRFSFQDWQRIDRLERDHGAALGKPRLKFTSRAAMHDALDA